MTATTTNLRPIDTITFSTTAVNGLGVTITDITLAYINVAASHAMLADGTMGVVSVANMTEMALLVAESDVKRFVRSVLAGTNHSFADLTGAEIADILFSDRNGWASETKLSGPRADAMFREAWNMGESLLCVNADGTVDWF